MRFLRWPFAFVVLMYQSAVLAMSQIWANKVRGILTTIGIMIGVASVTAVISTIKTLEHQVLSQFEAFGTNKMFIFPSRGKDERERFTPYVMFRKEHFEGFLERCPSIEKFTRLAWIPGPLTYRDKTETEVQIIGVEATWHEIDRRGVKIGRPLTMLDNEQLRPVCLIDEKGRDRLGLNKDPTGEYIGVGLQRFMIVGVVEPPTSAMNTRDVIEVYVPFTVASLGRERGLWVMAESKSPALSEEARAETVFFLRQRRHLKPAEPNNFTVETASRFLEQFQQMSAIITAIALGIVGISLLVGGVGIMNIMLVSVSERTREIGLRKAVGARPSAILLQFLVESVMLCLLGGIIGLLAGSGINAVISKFIPPEAHVSHIEMPAMAIFLALGFSGSVGLIFGIFPAIKAARLDPIEALRHE